ncbi:hypothetical protein MYVA_1128 [Mycolicibacterium vaccae 95051]|nr:hypothetical protein MYVA_1128 [Mycolicibacterium vaccae 95051]
MHTAPATFSPGDCESDRPPGSMCTVRGRLRGQPAHQPKSRQMFYVAETAGHVADKRGAHCTGGRSQQCALCALTHARNAQSIPPSDCTAHGQL